MKINEGINYMNIESYENDISNSNDIRILANTLSIDGKTYNRSDIKSDDNLKYVVYADSSDEFSWFEVFFTTKPFSFNKLEDYTS